MAPWRRLMQKTTWLSRSSDMVLLNRHGGFPRRSFRPHRLTFVMSIAPVNIRCSYGFAIEWWEHDCGRTCIERDGKNLKIKVGRTMRQINRSSSGFAPGEVPYHKFSIVHLKSSLYSNRGLTTIQFPANIQPSALLHTS